MTSPRRRLLLLLGLVLLWGCCLVQQQALASASPELERLLEATLEATCRNPADYAAWQERRRALTNQTPALAGAAASTFTPATPQLLLLLQETELSTVADEAVRRTPKCFQVWLHRRRVLERLLEEEEKKEEAFPPGQSTNSSQRVLSLLRQELEWSWEGLAGGSVGSGGGDPKNVHAWSHRRWVLDRALGVLAQEGHHAAEALLQEEVERMRALLEEGDLANNSAWVYRYGLLRRRLALGSGGAADGDADDADGDGGRAYRLCLAELLFTSRLLRRDPDNASAWAHLRGLLNPIALPLPPLARQRLHPLVTDAAAGHIVRKNQHGEGWLLARELVVDLQLAPPHAASPVLLRLARAKRLVERTLAEPDAEAPVLAVRRGYWEWKLTQVQAAIDAKLAALRDSRRPSSSQQQE